MSADHIVQIFQRVLDTSEVEASSDFFELGGDSLLATRVLSAIAREFGTELEFEDFVDDPTADGLFAKVAGVMS
ncbi:acyl carrier protein [Mycobacterium scrofulaceum]|uniref:Phosphopantetheine-containing protein n=1 Tax=Mycobacterium scrofulaceum TaxID=1783 RepID=A0A1A2VXC5_MYCSC|nr:acyl carrier protein [Mycobacterium scrofulaceum]OBI05575.1 phosphopantetheine-containing protein [Mycobacterium scrofulaceum]